MTNINLLYQMAELSEASYAEFNRFANMEDALTNKDFSSTQAAEFINNWTVLTHQPNTPSGYSSTLFQSTNSNINAEYVLAFRGTELGTQPSLSAPLGADLAADFGNIVTDGAAYEQIVDLYNDWQRIQAGIGNPYDGARIEPRLTETAALSDERALLRWTPGVIGPIETALRARNNVFIDDPTGVVITIQTGIASTELFTGDESVRALGDVNLPAGASVTVAGHSLGGHLAVAFTRLFSGEIANAESNIRNLFGMLGGDAAFDPTSIQNLYGSAAPEVVTMNNPIGLVQQGAHAVLFRLKADSPFTDDLLVAA